MSKWTYQFGGEITVEADSQEEASAKADEIIGITAYQYDNAEDISINEIELSDTDDEEYDWEI